MDVRIYQGRDNILPYSVVNIVIDVLRAFTVSHYALCRDVKKIILVKEVEEALMLRSQHNDYLLSGEIKGLPIADFDIGNSPKEIIQKEINDRVLVQKTTNGVAATLNALDAKHVLVTGYTNAKNTALYARKLIENEDGVVNIIASHPSSDEDMACSEYIRDIIYGNQVDTNKIEQRIKESQAAKKFLNPDVPEFDPEDVELAAVEIQCNFVMTIEHSNCHPYITKRLLNE